MVRCREISFSVGRFTSAGLLLSILTSCSGGPGSDVDDQPDDPPVAKAVVIGNAFNTDRNTDAINTSW